MALTLTEREEALRKLAALKAERERLLREANQSLSKVKKFEEDNKILFFNHPGKGYLGAHGTWELNPPQKILIKALSTGLYRLFLYKGANQIGKTTLECILALSVLRGHFPWEDPRIVGNWIWDLYKWKPPIFIRWIGGGWEEHIEKNLISQGLDQIWPKSWPVKTAKNNQGVKYMWQDLLTGGQINFMSHNQDRKAFAGWKGHLILYDEPFPQEIWAENLRALVAFGGIAMIGASLVEGDQIWIEDEIEGNAKTEAGAKFPAFVHEANIQGNVGHGLTQENVDAYAASLSPEERLVRIQGQAAGRQSKLLKIQQQIHCIKHKSIKDIPPDFLVDISIDYHFAKPQFILFNAIGPHDINYICHEAVSPLGQPAGAEWIVSSIVQTAKTYNLRVNRILMDPLAKSDRNNGDTIYDKVEQGLFSHGFRLETASKFKEDGIVAINSHLHNSYGNATLFFYEDALPIAFHQFKMWANDETGRPSKKNDDQCENLYRLINLNTSYTDPREDDMFIPSNPSSRDRNPITGY